MHHQSNTMVYIRIILIIPYIVRHDRHSISTFMNLAMKSSTSALPLLHLSFIPFTSCKMCCVIHIIFSHRTKGITWRKYTYLLLSDSSDEWNTLYFCSPIAPSNSSQPKIIWLRCQHFTSSLTGKSCSARMRFSFDQVEIEFFETCTARPFS